MKKRKMVWGIAGVVLALLAGLLILVRSDQSAAPTPKTGPATPPSIAAPAAPEPRPAPTAPAAPTAPTPDEEGGTQGVVTTIDERGHRVHEHESRPPTEPRVLTVESTMAVRKAAASSLSRCAREVPETAPRGASVTVAATIQANQGRVTVKDVVIRGGDALGEPYVACVKAAFGGVGLAAPAGQADGERVVHYRVRAR